MISNIAIGRAGGHQWKFIQMRRKLLWEVGTIFIYFTSGYHGVWVHNRAYGFIFCFIFSLFPCSLLFSGFGLYPSILIFLVDQKANNRRTRENHEILNGMFLYELWRTNYQMSICLLNGSMCTPSILIATLFPYSLSCSWSYMLSAEEKVQPIGERLKFHPLEQLWMQLCVE